MPETVDGVPLWLLKITVLALGAAFGSFANVLVHRVPLGQSIVRPASRCPCCGASIRWHDNVPILGWIWLGGKCRDCRAAISIRYPLVELVMAVLSLACLYLAVMRSGGMADVAGLAPLWAFPFAFCFLLVTLTFIDLQHWRIPHVFTVTGAAIGLASALLISTFSGVDWKDSLIGLVVGALPVVIIIEVYFRLTRREGMGYGDVMLLGMIGATLGVQSLPFVFLASSVQGLLVAVPMVLIARRSPQPPWEADQDPSQPHASGLRHAAVPFGPFLSVAAMQWLFFQDLLAPWFIP